VGQWWAMGRAHPSLWDTVGSGDNDMLQGMKEMQDGIFNAARALSRSHLGPSTHRDADWLLTHYQVFGHADAKLIRLLPEQVDWVRMHEVLHHTDEWCAQHDAVGMPRELVLRMHGLGSLIDLPEDMPLDPTVARLLGRRVQKM
jgi:hypothetical protein